MKKSLRLKAMVKKNKKSLSLSKDLFKATDYAAYLIAQMTGQDIALIKAKSEDEIFQYLSYLLSSKKKEEQQLNWRNDKSSDRDLSHDSHAYQLISKGIVNQKYKAYGTNKILHEFIKFFSAKLGDLAFKRTVDSRASSNLSNPYASIAQVNTGSPSKVSITNLSSEKLLSRVPLIKTVDAPMRGF